MHSSLRKAIFKADSVSDKKRTSYISSAYLRKCGQRFGVVIRICSTASAATFSVKTIFSGHAWAFPTSPVNSCS